MPRSARKPIAAARPTPRKSVRQKRAEQAAPPPRSRIADGDQIADHVADVMQVGWPAWSIDRLLTWPRQALQMARSVLARMGRPATDEAEHEVIRAALAARKRGKLRRDPA